MPLLKALLTERRMSLKGAYTNRDVANILLRQRPHDSRLGQEFQVRQPVLLPNLAIVLRDSGNADSFLRDRA